MLQILLQCGGLQFMVISEFPLGSSDKRSPEKGDHQPVRSTQLS